jgi:hypothetical protein
MVTAWASVPLPPWILELFLLPWNTNALNATPIKMKCAFDLWNTIIWSVNYGDLGRLLVQNIGSEKLLSNLHKLDTGPPSVNLVSEPPWFRPSFVSGVDKFVFVTRRVIWAATLAWTDLFVGWPLNSDVTSPKPFFGQAHYDTWHSVQ